MVHYLRVLTLSMLIGSCLSLTACDKEGANPQPTPSLAQPPPRVQKAALMGQFSPASAITLITASKAGMNFAIRPASDGSYSFPELDVGTYSLHFVPAQGFVPPTSISVVLAPGNNTIPTLTVGSIAASVTYKVDRVPVTPTYQSAVSLASGWMVGFPTGGWKFKFSTEPGGNGDAVTVIFDAPLKVGTFSLTGDEGISAQYTDPGHAIYSTQGLTDRASGTITITAFDDRPRRMSGTFSFVGIGSDSTTPKPHTKTISEGTFTNLSF